MQQIRYFIAVARTHSFTAAARDCHVSQPSLSIQVAKLEEELGGPLFHRARRGNRLTARGEIFLKRAQAGLEELEAGRRQLMDLAGLSQGEVALGCLPSTGTHLLPRVLAAFSRSHPGLRVRLREESSPGLAACLERDEVDLGILDEAGLLPGLEAEKLFSEELWLAVPRRHPLAKKGRAALKDLAGEPFILMKEGHGFRQISMTAFKQAGVAPKVVFESGEIETVQALVAAGMGLSLVPSMVRKESGPAYVRLSAPRPARSLYLARRRLAYLSPAAAALRAVVLKVLGDMKGNS